MGVKFRPGVIQLLFCPQWKFFVTASKSSAVIRLSAVILHWRGFFLVTREAFQPSSSFSLHVAKLPLDQWGWWAGEAFMLVAAKRQCLFSVWPLICRTTPTQ